jgi:hypothetical protein
MRWQYRSIIGKKLRTLICAVLPINPERSVTLSLNNISNLISFFNIGLVMLLYIVWYALADYVW